MISIKGGVMNQKHIARIIVLFLFGGTILFSFAMNSSTFNQDNQAEMQKIHFSPQSKDITPLDEDFSVSSAQYDPDQATPSQLQQYFTTIINQTMGNHHIPGAVLTVTNSSDILVSQEFGMANIEGNIPMNFSQSRLSIGEISGLFIWLAILDLWTENQVNLTLDVNEYLTEIGFTISQTYEKPITLENLMSHSAGFEDTIIGTEARNLDAIIPLSEYIQNYDPRRVREPGTLAAYTGYDVALAAYIMEIITEESYIDYLQTNIFSPMDLGNTDYNQSFEDLNQTQKSFGYSYKNNQNQAILPTYVNDIPARGIFTTGSDMARFLQYILNNGSIGSTTVFENETIVKLQQPLYQMDPRIPGCTYGLREERHNGVRVLTQIGDLNGFSSLYALFPDSNLAFFVSFNSEEGRFAREEILERFCENWFPDIPVLAPNPPEDFNSRAIHYIGAYRTIENPYTTIMKINSLYTEEIDIAIGSQNTLRMNQQFTLVEVDTNMFIIIETQTYVVFLPDEAGNIHYIIFENQPMTAYERTLVLDLPWIHRILPFVALSIFASVIIIDFIDLILHRHNKRKNKAEIAHTPPPSEKGQEFKRPDMMDDSMPDNGENESTRENTGISEGSSPPDWEIHHKNTMRKIAYIVQLSMAVFYLLFAAIYVIYNATIPWFQTGYDTRWLGLILIIPLIARLLNLGGLVFWLNVWRDKYWTRWRRIHYGMVIIIGLGFIWWLYYWNFFGFNY